MLWLEIAWAEVGTAEIEGPQANGAILEYFRDAGRSDILSDETAWCMAFYLACLIRAGIPITLEPDKRLLARSALEIGQKLDEPRVGCCAVLQRGTSSWQGHVGIVTAWTPTHIQLLGGNQSDAVNTKWFPREKLLGLRWPGLPVTAGELKEAGSRTVAKSGEVKKDGIKAAIAEFLGNATPGPGEAGELTKTLQTNNELAHSLVDFTQYLWAKWPLIATAIAVYFLARMVWNAGWISFWRVDDHNSGANVGREVDLEDHNAA